MDQKRSRPGASSAASQPPRPTVQAVEQDDASAGVIEKDEIPIRRTEPVVEVRGPKAYQTTATATPRVLAIFCGDPRFQGPIRQFLEREIGVKEGQYLPFVIRGGAASFTVGNFFPKETRYVTEGAVNYVNQFSSIDRVILINHEDCGKYKLLQKAAPFFFTAVKNMVDRQRLDLASVAQHLLGVFPRHLVIEQYFAKFADSNRTSVVFEKL